jgi:hypothetical protein
MNSTPEMPPILQVEPYFRVGSIEFGMQLDEIQQILGYDKNPKYRPIVVREVNELHQYFPQWKIKVVCNENRECCLVHVSLPSQVLLEGRHLLGESYEEVFEWLRKQDPDTKYLSTSGTLISERFGLLIGSIYKTDEGLITLVSFASKGYPDLLT